MIYNDDDICFCTLVSGWKNRIRLWKCWRKTKRSWVRRFIS